MRALSASELLTVWERGPTLSPVQRAVALLHAANPDFSMEEIARLSIGQRNGLLMQLREWTFGPQLTAMATCARCGERLELNFSSSEIPAAPELDPDDELALAAEGFNVRFRLPDSLDLAAVSGSPDVATARQALFERCLLSVHLEGEEKSAGDLPEHLVAVISERMEQADPRASVQLSLSCPACGHQWLGTFDIVTYFWNEIDGWAQGMLRDVHTLASAYGWHESDILSMSPWRRQFYLDMIRR